MMLDQRDIRDRLEWSASRKSDLDSDKELMLLAVKEIERLRSLVESLADDNIRILKQYGK